MDKIRKTETEWKLQLSQEAFRVTRQAGTERPFSGELYRVTAEGDYHCICCDSLLFKSGTKFDAGCGWPSFWQEAVPGSIERHRDLSHGMIREEVRCARCDAHLGHVFPDGPEPTGERYCINSVALKFYPD
ncbi:peptide-methionine (R)-S-oxide reductase MsrB [Chitinibacter sp. SCUT-21]|uniref:peptide-methionine (R)-S-oxide reductase MsrB n=1 Tax=Chitinibacter sp. SCUT-21 TaxID=2970891 RepID=UPI0035A5B9AF